jgi:cell shape-determining protein MreC
MLKPNHARLKTRLGSPVVQLAIGLALSVGLMCVPARHASKLKGIAIDTVSPALCAVASVRESARRVTGYLQAYINTARRLSNTKNKLIELEAENKRLSVELERLEAQARSEPGDVAGEPLLQAISVPARVLGRAARGYLERRHLLDAGSDCGIDSGALVLDAPAARLDQGANSSLRAGSLVLSGGRVWGKTVEVGPFTTSVRTVTEQGYRDVVRLASRPVQGHRIRWGPEAILEGTGERFARIRRVETTTAVSVGDMVYSAAAKGITSEPLFYGRIIRVRRPVGASHWELWMEPAVGANEPETVAVMCVELNPLRLAERP